MKRPEEVADDDAILLSDIFPTAWFGARLAEVEEGDVVAVLGCGIVGMFAILTAQLQGTPRPGGRSGPVAALAGAPARCQVLDFPQEDPVERLTRPTGGSGADRIIDAVGIDSESSGEQRDPGRAAGCP